MPAYRAFGTLRFALAIAVVLSHTFAMSLSPDNLLSQIGLGNVAVMGFFMLSGFIIAEALTTFYAGRPFAFMGNRLVRIVPPYWAALALSIAVHVALSQYGPVRTSPSETLPEGAFDTGNLLENVLAIFPRPSELTAALDHPFYGFVRFYWAVYIELLFYGAAFLVALAAAVPYTRRTQLGKTIVILAGASAVMLHISGEYAEGEILAFPGRLGFGFAPYFLVGVSLYFWLTVRSRAALTGLAISYCLVALHFSRYVQGKISISAAWADGLLEPRHAVPVLLLLLVPVILWRLSTVAAGSLAKGDWRLGNLSYPIYLNHWIVIVAFYSLTDGRGIVLQASAVAVSVALSWLLMRAVETPMTTLRDRLRGQPVWAKVESTS